VAHARILLQLLDPFDDERTGYAGTTVTARTTIASRRREHTATTTTTTTATARGDITSIDHPDSSHASVIAGGTRRAAIATIAARATGTTTAATKRRSTREPFCTDGRRHEQKRHEALRLSHRAEAVGVASAAFTIYADDSTPSAKTIFVGSRATAGKCPRCPALCLKPRRTATSSIETSQHIERGGSTLSAR
jgi:hypothetical protein